LPTPIQSSLDFKYLLRHEADFKVYIIDINSDGYSDIIAIDQRVDADIFVRLDKDWIKKTGWLVSGC
jgi:hypothetical protein